MAPGDSVPPRCPVSAPAGHRPAARRRRGGPGTRPTTPPVARHLAALRGAGPGGSCRRPSPTTTPAAPGARSRSAEAPGAWRSLAAAPAGAARGAAVRTCAPPCSAPRSRTPIGVAPWAYQALAHPDGERGDRARGAAAAGALMTRVDVGQHLARRTSPPTEPHCAEVVPALPPALPRAHRRPRPPGRAGRATGRWCSPSTCRSSADGCATWRNDFALPADLPLANHPPSGTAVGRRHPGRGRSTTSAGSPSCPGCRSWSRASSAADDAARCVQAGAAAVWVSTHGGRQADPVVASAARPPGDRRTPSATRSRSTPTAGIRSGSDVLTALALGATRRLRRAVRPSGAWRPAAPTACRASSPDSPRQLAHTMALCGLSDVRSVPRDTVTPAR